MRKIYDHTPHELFVELEELQQTNYGGLEWKETARWIKYEENVIGVDNRWGKPHIAFLNFSALFHLRKELEHGALLLDLEERDLPSITLKVVEHMISSNQILPNQKESVAKVLLLKQRHIKENLSAFRKASRITIGTREDEPHSVQSPSVSQARRPMARKPMVTMFRMNSLPAGPMDGNVTVDNQSWGRNSLAQLEVESVIENKEKVNVSMGLLEKLPADAEAVAVLIGSLDFLTEPTIAFVRLAQCVLIDNLIEVPLPVRFIFVLLGPYDVEMDYREIGRCFSTLMSDKYFRNMAYRAYSRGQFLAAISEFLNASILFPPTEWKNNDLVPIDEIQNKAQEIRRRKEDQKTKFQEAKIASLIKKDEPGEIKEPPPRDPLKRKGRPFYGLIQDVKIRYSKYWNDLRDGLNPQVLSTSIFIFFAALASSLTIGGIYSEITNKAIGVGETLFVACINGVIYSLLAAQPLVMGGPNGPLMIFDMSLLNFCENMDIDFLSIRVWVGIWILVIGLLVAAFEAVVIVKKFTRFSEEIYSTLVCLIFINVAFENLALIFKKHPLSSSPSVFRASNDTHGC